MKLLVIGAKGLLGQFVVKTAEAKKMTVVGSDVSDEGGIDITKIESISAFLDKESPDAVINCAAFTNVETCEEEKGFEIAKAVNGDGPVNLCKACLERNIDFVHISTDYVFGDNNPDGYAEDYGVFKPLNKYAETKLIAEQGIMKQINSILTSDSSLQSSVYIIRTSWLFGPGAQNFIAKIIQYAKEKDYLDVVTDEISSPTYIKDLAERIIWILENKPKSGIYHVSGLGKASRYDFAREILKWAKINTEIRPSKLADFPRKATVPNISYLLNTKLPPMRPWQEMVKDFIIS